MQIEETDFLIVGAGPAGGSLACFLGEHGLKGVMIASAPSTADTPRAHITNMAATECLRDIGLEQECLAQATSSGCMEHTRWCVNMAGEEYGRIHSWGHDPHRQGDYSDASPCNHVDLPQTLLEPIMVNRAKERGWDVRFNNTLVSFDDQGTEKGIVSEIKNTSTNTTYHIRSRYLFGADGGRSAVAQQLNLPFIRKPGGGLALNVLAEVDLSEYIKSRVGNLHWTIDPTNPFPDWGWMAIVRMVEPWTRWMFIILPSSPDFRLTPENEPSHDDYMKRVKEFIGDDSLPVKIINVSKWYVNEVVAEFYSNSDSSNSSGNNNIFCIGDACHRHPPFNGLGSNTCIQDSYNLAWKIAYVEKGLAKPSILHTYSAERQPVGLGVITRANQGFRDHLAVWQALGMMEPDTESRAASFNELNEATPAGRERRQQLKTAIEGTCTEFHAVGQEMNQRYDESASSAIYLEDEPSARPQFPDDKNPVLHYQISSYPGSRLPHAWLNTRVPQTPQISTQDLAGHGRFTLFTGLGGKESWQAAAAKVQQDLGVEVKVWSIGWMQDYEDVYFDWEKWRGVEDDGCVLVRPDRFVAWRCKAPKDIPEGINERLGKVMRKILGK